MAVGSLLLRSHREGSLRNGTVFSTDPLYSKNWFLFLMEWKEGSVARSHPHPRRPAWTHRRRPLVSVWSQSFWPLK